VVVAGPPASTAGGTEVGRLRRLLWRRVAECVLGADVTREIRLPPRDINIDVVRIGLENLPDGGYLRRSVIKARLGRGDVGLAARAEGRIVSSVWIAHAVWRMADLGLAVRLNPRQAVLYDAYTVPEYRRHGIMAALARECVEDVRARGRQWVFARSRQDNANTKSTLGRAGFEELITINGVMVFGMFGRYHLLGHEGKEHLLSGMVRSVAPLRPALLSWDDNGRRRIRMLWP
jgi:GNAT superfamily N-acetyltransferase